MAHLVKEKGENCYYRLVELLGKDILETESGEIDKKKMAALIFGDDELLEKVNEILAEMKANGTLDAILAQHMVA